MKTGISQSEYLQLVGLMRLAQIHERNVISCRDAILETLGLGVNGEQAGHVDDEIWGRNQDVDQLLKRLQVAVEAREVGNA